MAADEAAQEWLQSHKGPSETHLVSHIVRQRDASIPQGSV